MDSFDLPLSKLGSLVYHIFTLWPGWMVWLHRMLYLLQYNLSAVESGKILLLTTLACRYTSFDRLSKEEDSFSSKQLREAALCFLSIQILLSFFAGEKD